jgi:hypothetical protein
MRRRWLFALLSTLLLGLPGLTGSTAQAGGSGEDFPGPCGWRRVPSQNIDQDGDNILFGVAAVSTDDVWAVGRYGLLPYYTLVEHWDGTAWTVVPSPNPSDSSNELQAVSAVSANDVWAVGHFYNDQSRTTETLIVHWDGVAWSVVPSPNPDPTSNVLHDVVAIAPDDAYAVGDTLAFRDGPLILHWDGVSWTEVAVPDLSDGAATGVAATSSSDVWVVGWAGRTITMHWDGSTWTVHPTSTQQDSLYGITALSSGDAWVVGHTYALERTLVDHWDGRAWTRQHTPNIGDSSNHLFEVDAISPDDVWAVGNYFNSEEQAHLPLMLHWDGTQWTATGRRHGPRATSQLADVAAISSTDVWAAGWGPGQNRSLTLQYKC